MKNDNTMDFYPLEETAQNILIKLRTWDQTQCLYFLKEKLLPSLFTGPDLTEAINEVETLSFVELKTALISILQNTRINKIIKPSILN